MRRLSLRRKVKSRVCVADLFGNGFGTLLQDQRFSDVSIVCEGKTYRVHRLLLAYSSPYFARLLHSDSAFCEATQPVIYLRFPDPAGVFPLLLQFLYQGDLVLTEENVLPILCLADHYLVKELKKLCSDFISQTITRENAVNILKKAIEFHSDETIRRCLLVIARNFSNKKLAREDYTFLPYHIFMTLLYHRFLAVKNEEDIFITVCKYVEAHQDDLTEEQINTLMESVRFRWLNYEQLEDAVNNPLVPRYLLVEALMAIVRDQKFPHNRKEESNPRLQERLSYGIDFEYRGSGESMDILSWIATNSGTDKWQNPVLSGRIKVAASSIEKGHPGDLFVKDPSEFWTKDVPASWFQIDLGEQRAVVPTYYTLRHGGNYKADSLRTWDFQGSVDGTNWTLLRRHVNDESLNEQFATHSWPIEGQTRAYRFFRILQTGHNSSNHNFLVLSGVELYGSLYEGDIEEINKDLAEMDQCWVSQ
jgi:hypothetical protein